MAGGAAAHLAAIGAAPGDRCAILAENSARWCAAYLGILRLGAVAVPFDTTYSAAQVTTLLQDSGAACLIASPRFAAMATMAAPGSCRIVGLDAATQPGAAFPGTGPAGPDHPAVILYTSGTTANPKGVVLTHGNLLAEKEGVFQVVAVDERDVVLGVLPLFHALAQMANLLLPFSIGAHVVFLEALNTRELLAAMRDEQVTVFCCVPQFFYLIHQRVMGEVSNGAVARKVAFRALLAINRTMLTAGINVGPRLFARVHRTLGPKMRLLITGGSRFDPAIGLDLHAMGLTILQVYGLTETSGAATVSRPGEPIATVGRPLPGVDIRIAEPQGSYADGEVLIRGPVVMSGYWNRPNATVAVLRDGWLYTGDLGRLDAEGRLSITGRSKETIVLQSGKNIYPEEIETHYAQSAFIKELCVIGVTEPDTPSAERLHAVVVPDADVLRERRIVNVTELIRFELEGLSVALPGHKRVLGFEVSMQPLPRTTTGKLKRHEVARRDASAGRAVVSAAEDAGDLGNVVALVQELIARPVTVTADSNFELDLGLDSMERVELLAALEERLGVSIAADAAQRAFTVRELAAAASADTIDGRLLAGRSEASVGVGAASPPAEATSWRTLLHQVSLPAGDQARLLGSRPIAAFVLFITSRFLGILLLRPRVRGLEHLPASGPFILAPNHQSYLDPFAIVGVLPFRIFKQLFFVGATEYFQTSITAWLASRLNIVPVDPDANLVPAMQAGAFGLRAGKVLVLFPEGERSIDGTVKKFKKGAGLLSENLGVPIVPVAIEGMFDLWPRNRPLNWTRLLPWSRHHARIAFAPPLAPADHPRLRDEVERMWQGLRHG